MPVPLHVHSWYSLLEGVSSPESLLRRAAECGYPALALTDVNNLYGAVTFAQRAGKNGVRAIFGACLYDESSRCVALIAAPAGYRSLCRIISRLNLGDPFRRDPEGSVNVSPRLLNELLAENADGLHVLIEDANLARQLRDAFGARLWLEVARPRLGRTAREEGDLIEECRRLDVRPVASTNAHFARPEEFDTYRLVTAVREGLLLEDRESRIENRESTTRGRGPRPSILTAAHHIPPLAEFWRRFADLPEVVRNTDVLADQLSSDVLPHALVLPPPKLPRQLDEARFLRLLCERGLRQRFEASRGRQPSEATDRLRDELAVIEARGLAGYFLVVRDIARYARRRGHPMALRGSAGNSLVCFLLEITDVDPLRFGLPMERFLHPGRPDLPDIDLDFDWKVRDDVIAHVFDRYGHDRTAMISSHLFLQPRSAFREAAKAHGLSNEQISRLIETLSERVGSFFEDGGSNLLDDRDRMMKTGKSREAQLSPDPQSAIHHPQSSILDPRFPTPRGFPLEPERWPRILTDARRLLGRPHHLSIHPGGVVITPGPIEDHVPLERAAKGIVITQLDKDGAEAIGLVKIDLLGNRALGTVEEGWRAGGVSPRRNVLPEQACGPPGADAPGSPATIALLQRGDTLGVNQLESPAMRHLLVQMKPMGVDHVIQALALIRPAAASIGAKEAFVRRRRGLDPVRFLHSCLEPVLRETHGLMLYEDDALRVIQALTGLDAPAADHFRKRVAKHQTDEEATQLAREFLVACAHHGIPRSVAETQWVELAKFNRYSFCKSHAVSYGLIAWRAAWLKAHHPLPFWCAALNNNQGIYPRRVYIEAAKRAGIRVLLPCVNRSAGPFVVESAQPQTMGTACGLALRTGLDAVGSLDEALRGAILADRNKNGPYRGLADFRRRVEPGPEALSLLIRCGAFDFTGRSRPELFLEVELSPFIDLQDAKARAFVGVPPLGGGKDRLKPGLQQMPALPFGSRPSEDWHPADYSAERRLRDEWDILGFVAGPPLMALFRKQVPRGLQTSRELRRNVGQRIRLAGLVAAARMTETEDGRDMQFITLEDEWGLVECTLFPGSCRPIPHLTLGPYLVSGIVEEQYDVLTVTAERFEKCE